MLHSWSFHTAGSLIFGRESIGQLPEVLGRFAGKRLFLVADPNLERSGIIARVRDAIAGSGFTVATFLIDLPEPSLEVVRAAVSAARAFAPDIVLGLGGGSNMDAAKLVAAALAHACDPLALVGEFAIPGPILPLICIPTTAGTGSEVSPAAVFTDTERKIKVSCLSPFLRPAVAIVDPLLTLSCPPRVTADSGIDALTHAIEAFTAIDNDRFAARGPKSIYQGKNPLADMMAREAIALVGNFLRRAVADGGDIEAREGMALAGVLGGLAFSNAGVALVHAMEYPVGGAVHISHGAGNGLLLPYVMDYNLRESIAAFSQIALLLGENLADHTPGASAQRSVRAVQSLRRDIGIPDRLRDIGVQAEMLPGFAASAYSIKRLLRVNPRMPRDESEILAIYRDAF